MEILWSQEKKLASQDNFLAFFFLKMTFFLGFFFFASPTKLANFSWIFLAVFFFLRQQRDTPTGGGGFFRVFHARLAKIKTPPPGVFASFRPWILFPRRKLLITDENRFLEVGFFLGSF